jgi:death-on-curing protein
VKEPAWIEERETLAIHGRLLALHGGAIGLRDRGLLESALARPRQLHAYGGDPGIVDLAAAYATATIRNHPFMDGNKRTGFLLCVLFLETNGYRFIASEEDAIQAVMGLAASVIDERSFATWLRENARRVSSAKKRLGSAGTASANRCRPTPRFRRPQAYQAGPRALFPAAHSRAARGKYREWRPPH